MKKQIIFVLIAILFINFTTAFALGEITATINQQTGKLVISGSFGDANIPLLIRVFSPTDSLLQMDTATTNQTGAFSYEYTFLPFSSNGNYTVVVTKNGGRLETKLSFTQDMMQTYLNNIANEGNAILNISDAEAFVNKYYSEIIEPLNISYTGDMKIAIDDYILNGVYNNFQELISGVATATILRILNYGSTDEKKSVLENYMQSFNPSVMIIYNNIKKGKNDVILKFDNAITFKSISEVLTFFNQATALSALNSVHSGDYYGEYGQLLSVFSENATLNIDLTGKYLTIKSNERKLNDFYAKLQALNYLTLKDFETNFKNELANFEITNNKGSTGISGGRVTTQIKQTGVSVPEIQAPQQSFLQFADISEYKWAETAINELNKSGVVNGVSNEKFEPSRNVTRAELIKMLCKQYNIKALDTNIPFVDIESGAWYADFIAIAYSNGLVNGYNGKFYPNNPVTREEMAVLVYRFALNSGKTFLDTGRQIIYTDDDKISDYAKEAISKMSNSGFISGIGNGFIAPKNYANRAEAATIIYQMR